MIGLIRRINFKRSWSNVPGLTVAIADERRTRDTNPLSIGLPIALIRYLTQKTGGQDNVPYSGYGPA
jgi:hypothetical protein